MSVKSLLLSISLILIPASYAQATILKECEHKLTQALIFPDVYEIEEIISAFPSTQESLERLRSYEAALKNGENLVQNKRFSVAVQGLKAFAMGLTSFASSYCIIKWLEKTVHTHRALIKSNGHIYVETSEFQRLNLKLVVGLFAYIQTLLFGVAFTASGLADLLWYFAHKIKFLCTKDTVSTGLLLMRKRIEELESALLPLDGMVLEKVCLG